MEKKTLDSSTVELLDKAIMPDTGHRHLPVAVFSTTHFQQRSECPIVGGQFTVKSEHCDCDHGCTACGGTSKDASNLSLDSVRNCQRGSRKQRRLNGRKTVECVAKDSEVPPRQSIAGKTPSLPGEVNSAQLMIGHLKRDKLTCSVHCSICRMPFKDMSALKAHTASHRVSTAKRKISMAGKKTAVPFVCNHCGRVFKSVSTLNSHVMTHTGERRIPCRVAGCNKRFTQHSTRSFHERTHSDDMPHMCAVCGRRFKHAVGVHLHMSVHTGYRPHQCSSCPMTFRRSCDLQRHSRVHSAERPYQCQICLKSFKTKRTLSRHILALHTDEIPWRCSICDKGFKTSGNLRVHLRVHTGDKPYICAVCGLQFSYSSSLKSHEQVHVGSD